MEPRLEVWMAGMMTGVPLDGTNEDCEQMCDASVSSFSH